MPSKKTPSTQSSPLKQVTEKIGLSENALPEEIHLPVKASRKAKPVPELVDATGLEEELLTKEEPDEPALGQASEEWAELVSEDPLEILEDPSARYYCQHRKDKSNRGNKSLCGFMLYRCWFHSFPLN